MEIVKSFCNDYGYSLLMLVLAGAVIAILIEITVKKVFDWLEPKFDEKGRKILSAIRGAVIQACTWTLTVMFTGLIVDNMPLPGGKVFLIIWIPAVYIIQYLFSMYGIKGIISAARRRVERAELPKPVKKDPLEGMTRLSDNCYTDGQGHYFTAKGKTL